MDASQLISLPGRGFSIWIRQGDAIIPQGNPYAAATRGQASSESTTISLPGKGFSLWAGALLPCNTIAESIGTAPTTPSPSGASIALPGNAFTLWTKPAATTTASPAPAASPASKSAAPSNPTIQSQQGQSSLLPAVLVSIVLIPLLLILGAFTYQQINELSDEKERRKKTLVDNEKLKTEVQALAASETALQDSVKKAEANAAQIKKNLAEARTVASAKTSDLENKSKEIAQQTAALEKAKADAETTKSELAARITQLEKERDTAGQQLETTQKNSAKAVEALETQVTKANDAAAKLAAEKAALESELNAAKDTVTKLTQQVEELNKQAEEADAEAEKPATIETSNSEAEADPLP